MAEAEKIVVHRTTSKMKPRTLSMRSGEDHVDGISSPSEISSIASSFVDTNMEVSADFMDDGTIVPKLRLGTVNHFSIELIWEESLKRAKEKENIKVPIKVILEYKPLHKAGAEWCTVYKGMAKRSIVSDLSPKTAYEFRYKLETKTWSSDWSQPAIYETSREPMYASNLHIAITRKDAEMMEEVLRSGDVSPDVQNEEGFSALMAASKKSFIEAIDLLIQFGADVDHKNHAGKTAMMVACTANQLESMQALRRHNADWYQFDNGGCTVVHWAVDSRNIKMLEWMASEGVDFNIQDKGIGGWTPLIRCANMHGDRDVGLTLMMNGANINAQDNNGSTALHHAVNRKHYELTQVLMQRRANPLMENKEGTTPWQIAQSGDDKKRIMMMMEPYVEELKKKKKAFHTTTAGKSNNNSTLTTTTATASTPRSPSKTPLRAIPAVQ